MNEYGTNEVTHMQAEIDRLRADFEEYRKVKAGQIDYLRSENEMLRQSKTEQLPPEPWAELARLCVELIELAAHNFKHHAENGALRAENAELLQEVKAIMSIRAKLEEKNSVIRTMDNELDRMRAENEQLRIDKITLGNFGTLPDYRSS